MDSITPSDRLRISRALGWRFMRASYAATASWLFRRAVRACQAAERGRLTLATARLAVTEYVDHVTMTGAPLAAVRRQRRERGH